MTAVSAIGRILLAAIFVISGVMKVITYAASVGFAAQAGLPLPEIAIGLAAAVEIGAGICVVLGYRVWSAAWVLVAFMVPTTIIFHHNIADQNQMAHCLKNISIIGGLVVLAYSDRLSRVRPMPATTVETERREFERMRS